MQETEMQKAKMQKAKQREEIDTWSSEEFYEQLKAIGRNRYHHKHPFNKRMHEGELSKEELRIWIVNRFYYQINLPIKDSIILSKLPSRLDRRYWIQRIIDHDGSPLTGSFEEEADTTVNAGTDFNNERGPEICDQKFSGIEAWLHLGEAAGIDRQVMCDKDQEQILPGVKFAVDAYVNFCRNKSWYEAVASSLTELFAPGIIEERISVFENKYKWIDSNGLLYFKRRLSQAPRDCDHALKLVLEEGKTRELQDKAIDALNFKCDVLWSLLDAVESRCGAK